MTVRLDITPARPESSEPTRNLTDSRNEEKRARDTGPVIAVGGIRVSPIRMPASARGDDLIQHLARPRVTRR